MTDQNISGKPSDAPSKAIPSQTARDHKEKRRAQPGDFERQVEQIRRDMTSVRSHLNEAEKVLKSVEIYKDEQDEDAKPDPEAKS